MRRPLLALLALASFCWAGCGGEPGPPKDPLVEARAADARGDREAVRAKLEAAEALDDERGRVATTWRLQVALTGGDVPAALARLRRIVERFQGRGEDARGRTYDARLLAEVVVRAAAEGARERVEGPAPHAEHARRLLTAGREALALGGDDDEEGRALLDRAGAWVALGDGPMAPRLADAGIPAGKGPLVVVVADPFEMGEPVLPSVLRRWARSLSVVLAGRPTGEVRVGIRRVKATPEEERAVMAEAARRAGVRFAGVLAEEAPLALGLADAGAAVLVIGPDDRLAGRVAGRSLDPRALDDLVARLSGR